MIYVGKTVSPVTRLYDHRTKLGATVKMRIIQNTFANSETLDDAERKWIRHYKQRGAPLLNRHLVEVEKSAAALAKYIAPEALEFFKDQGSKGGKLGGAKAWENLTPEERSERARKASLARKKKKAKKAGK